MKKLGLFIMPAMALFLLASCNKEQKVVEYLELYDKATYYLYDTLAMQSIREYDEQHRIVTKEENTFYDYDGDEKLISYKDVKTIKYDNHNNPTSTKVTRFTGDSSTIITNLTYTYAYDDANNITNCVEEGTDTSGEVHYRETATYDDHNRPLKREYYGYDESYYVSSYDEYTYDTEHLDYQTLKHYEKKGADFVLEYTFQNSFDEQGRIFYSTIVDGNQYKGEIIYNFDEHGCLTDRSLYLCEEEDSKIIYQTYRAVYYQNNPKKPSYELLFSAEEDLPTYTIFNIYDEYLRCAKRTIIVGLDTVEIIYTYNSLIEK